MEEVETRALLATDPPIDDDSYHYEAQSYPSDLQKHIVYTGYTIAVAFSRLFEITGLLAIALTYSSSLIPVTVFALVIIFTLASNGQISTYFVTMTRSRFRMLTSAIIVQHLLIILFCSTLLLSLKWWSFLTAVIVYALQRIANGVFQSSFQFDWCRIITNDQTSPYANLISHVQSVSFLVNVITPTISGFLIYQLDPLAVLRALRVGAVLAALVELGLIWKLYNTCYALRLPRAPDPETTALVDDDVRSRGGLVSGRRLSSIGTGAMSDHVGLVETGTESNHVPSASAMIEGPFKIINLKRLSIYRISRFIASNPLPVVATVGVIFVRTSLLIIGPQIMWYLGVKNVSPFAIGLLRSIETLAIRRTWTSNPWISPTVIVVGAVASTILISSQSVHAYLFGVAVVFGRTGTQGLEKRARNILEQLVADPEIFKLYRETEASFQGMLDFFLQFLTLIWSSQAMFRWPVIISATLTVLGVIMVVVVGKLIDDSN